MTSLAYLLREGVKTQEHVAKVAKVGAADSWEKHIILCDVVKKKNSGPVIL